MNSKVQLVVVVLVVLLGAAHGAPRVAAAQLPPQWRWLQAHLPPAATAGAALRGFFESLPSELCALGPQGLSSLPDATVDELLCPLMAARRLAPLRLRGRTSDDSAAIEELAARPRTLGGALALLAAANASDAAALQARTCRVLQYPQDTCGGASWQRAEGPLLARLDSSHTAAQWAAGKAARAALVPAGAALGALPQALCKVPRGQLLKMPEHLKWQLCPYDVALVPVVTLLVMGRSDSGALHAKLCDILKRGGACVAGQYKVDNTTAQRIKDLKAAVAKEAWTPSLPQLPAALLASLLNSTRATAAGGPKSLGESLAWLGGAAAAGRRAAVDALVPPQLHAAVRKLLAGLPAAVCSIDLDEAARLPSAFKREFCSRGQEQVVAAAGGAPALRPSTWAAALAESAMGPDAAASWTDQMCRSIYTPQAACARASRGAPGATKPQ